MYKKILVPLDGSAIAESTLRHAEAIAKGCNVPEIVLLSVATEMMPSWGVGEAPWVNERTYAKAEADYEASLKEYLDKMVKTLRAEGITASGAVEKGNPAERIVDYAKEKNVDLIIISAHGRSGSSTRWPLGSIADRIIRLSPVAVMVVQNSQ